MNDQTNMAQLRYLEELKISLVHAGFEPERMIMYNNLRKLKIT